MYEWDDQLSYVESVDFKGDQGSYLAPDECRVCYTQDNKIVQNCTVHHP